MQLSTSSQDLAPSVERAFGIAVAAIDDLGGEIDRNLRVTAVDGRRYTLKLAGPHASTESLELENSVLDAFAAAGIPAPQVQRSVGGALIVELEGRSARLLSWVDGFVLGEVERRELPLLEQVGAMAARVALSLADLRIAALERTHHWDLRRSDAAIRDCLPGVSDPRQRAIAEHMLDVWSREVAGRLEALPVQPVHQDLNDYNVVVQREDSGALVVSGVLDVGDALLGLRVAELAIAAAYSMLRQADPLAAAAAVTRGFCSVLPLTEAELEVAFPLACVRLATNASTWTQRLALNPDIGVYADLRSRHTWGTLALLTDVDPDHARATIRAAGGLVPSPATAHIAEHLGAHPPVAPLAAQEVVDLSASSSYWDDAPLPEGVIRATHSGRSDLRRAGIRLSGRDEPETIATGSIVMAQAGAQVLSPADGVAELVADDVVVVRHEPGYRTVLRGVIPVVAPGPVAAGDLLATAAGSELSIQLTVAEQPPPLYVRPSESEAWLALCLDPAELLLGLGPAPVELEVDEVLELRDERTGRSQRSYYCSPPNLVRAQGVWFTDDLARNYLDAVNNVTHVGHGHPRIIEAARRQMKRLNTNSRFVYKEFARYAERLTGLLPDPLNVVFFVCTGSEANDLAMRIAQTATGRTDTVVIDGAYHGNTISVTGISPHRYKGAGGTGAPPTTVEIPQPNRYRGEFGYDDPDAGARYVARSAAVIDARPTPPAAVITESLMGTAGQIIHPPGYLSGLYDKARSVGALCIADEVQVGFSRLGTNYWGFQDHGVVPDIVTMGKPMGNGHPLAAVVTTREIADAFDNGMRYFNTFGGNPVSCAVGMAVLDVIEDEGLQAKADVVGKHLLNRLQGLQDKHEIVGDVRGHGLYAGVELVRDRVTKEPATKEAYAISERMKDEGVFTYPNGFLENILKLKPPMVFGTDHADIFADTLDRVLSEGW